MLEQEGYDRMAAAFEVYNEKGHGFLEDIYQECLEMELEDRKIPFIPQDELTVFYKKRPLKEPRIINMNSTGALNAKKQRTQRPVKVYSLRDSAFFATLR